MDSDGLARYRLPLLPSGLAGGAARRHRHRRDRAGGPARSARQRRSPGQGASIASWRPSPPPPAGQPGPRCSTRASTLAHADALGIRPRALRWAWPLAARAAYELGDTADQPGAAQPARLVPGPGTLPRCCGPNAISSAPGSPTRTATRPPRHPSPPPSAACASSAPPTISPTACSTTPSISAAHGRRRGRCSGHRRSRSHRSPARLSAAAGPSGRDGAGQDPGRSVEMVTSPDPRNPRP